MKFLCAGAAGALVMTASMAGAVGLDRSNQDIGVIFETGNFGELSFGVVRPSLTGQENPTPFNPGGVAVDNVGEQFSTLALALKMDINENLSFGLIMDQPFGVDVAYGGAPATTLLGGTAAALESNAITALVRYRLNDSFSFHAGVRRQTMSADVTLSGLAYGPLSGYNVALTNGVGTGWLAGVAYERPDIALRVALTYHSEIENEFDALETMGGATVANGTTTVSSPEAWNLDFQTGIAANTLLFGQIRHAMYEQTVLSPDFFAGATGGASITDIDNGTAYSIGIGRRFSDSFSGSVSVGYEAPGEDDLVSPLSPTDGNISVSVGGQYTMGDVILSGGIRYTMLGDARPETGTPDTARATFEGSSALAAGVSVGFRF